jgi:hypothetical protein
LFKLRWMMCEWRAYAWARDNFKDGTRNPWLRDSTIVAPLSI